MMTIFCKFLGLPSGATVWNLVVLPLKCSPVGWKTNPSAHRNGNDSDGLFQLGQPGSINCGSDGERHPHPRSQIHARGTLENQDAGRDLTGRTSFRTVEGSVERAGVGSSEWAVEGPFVSRCAGETARDRIHSSSPAATTIREETSCGDYGPIRAEALTGVWSSRHRIRELATLRLVDRVIAEKLNAEGMKSGSGRPWTANSVKHVRLEHRIARSTVVPRCRSRLPDRHPDGRYSMRGAMKRFGVSHRQILRWVECGMLQAVREDFEDHQSVWWVTIDADAAERIEQRKTTKRRSQDAEIPDDGDAL